MATASSNDLFLAWKDLEVILHAGPKGETRVEGEQRGYAFYKQSHFDLRYLCNFNTHGLLVFKALKCRLPGQCEGKSCYVTHFLSTCVFSTYRGQKRE